VLTLSAKLSTCGISIQYILNHYQWQIHNIETTVKIEVKMLVQMKFFFNRFNLTTYCSDNDNFG